MTKFQKFKELHQQTKPLQIGNVWDCQSALMFEKLGYKAIGTSSAAIANSLGYDDGEQMGFEELNTIVKRITSKISVPLTVDLEGGYSRDVDQIINNIVTLHNGGVVGINLEDSVVNKNRDILNADEFGKSIKAITAYLTKNQIDIFLNIRTDAYLMGLDDPLQESISRIQIYEKFGADGVFVPGITSENDITRVVESTSLPVNIMAMPDLPTFEILKKCGVKRMSMGPSLYIKTVKNLEDTLIGISKDQTFNSLFF